MIETVESHNPNCSLSSHKNFKLNQSDELSPFRVMLEEMTFVSYQF
jgi:hypothetical protein